MAAAATQGKITAEAPAAGSGAGDSSLPDPSNLAKWWLLGLLVLAAILALVLNALGWTATAYTPTGANFSLVAGFYVAAQVIERLLELVSPLFPLWDYEPAASAQAADSAQAAADKETDPGSKAAASAQAAKLKTVAVAALAKGAVLNGAAKAAQIKADRATVLLGVATVLGVIASCVFGLFFLETIGMHVDHTVDAFVTGTTIGAGTKPLHDLISLIQNQTTPTTGTSA